MPLANIDNRNVPATDGKRISFNDSTEVKLSNGKFPRGFVPEADGTVSVVMAEDHAAAAPTTIVVKQGLVYPFSCRIFKSTGSATVTHVFVFG